MPTICGGEQWVAFPDSFHMLNSLIPALRNGSRPTPSCHHSTFTVAHLPHLRLCILLHSSSKRLISWAEHTLYSQDLSMFKMLAPWRVGRTQRQQLQVPLIAGIMISNLQSVGWKMSSPWSPCLC